MSQTTFDPVIIMKRESGGGTAERQHVINGYAAGVGKKRWKTEE